MKWTAFVVISNVCWGRDVVDRVVSEMARQGVAKLTIDLPNALVEMQWAFNSHYRMPESKSEIILCLIYTESLSDMEDKNYVQ